MARAILLLSLKRHLKTLYHISSTTVALASLTVDQPAVSKRDRIVSGVEVKELSLPKAVLEKPSTFKQFLSIVKLFHTLTFVDPVETAK